MPSLTWIGKDAVLNHHLDVPYRVLEKKYDFGDGEPGNKIIHGDNLEALKSLLPEYEGRVKCIYIDPPYNTGNENWVYNDNVNSPKIKKWLGQVVGKESEDLTRHDKWLCMMYPRLKLLQKLLSNDGAIFISIDDNEQANLKLVCDEIFGAGNFVGELIWKKKQGGGNDSNNIVVEHEYVISYAKLLSSFSLGLDTNYQLDEKLYPFEDAKGKYGLITLDKASIQFSPSLVYEIISPSGEKLKPRIVKGKQSCWRWSKEKVSKQYNDLVFKNGKVYTKYYRPLGVTQRSLLVDTVYGRTESGNDDIKAIFDIKPFDYPKPVALTKHLLSIATDKSSTILDSFAGSGTTAHAVLNLNKQDGGNRKFILVEMEDYAETITAERVRRVIDGYGEGKNAVEGTGGSFSYYELGPELLKDGFINEDVPEQTIREYLYYTETNHVLPQSNNGHPAHLGNFEGVAYYFLYNKDETTTLDATFLASISEKADRYVIYADNCIMPQKFLFDHDITFKKIPRDIRRF
ncbi:MAG: site-specific DNA-methyltransferase [Fibrobacter sp.]|uniref:site-specific DNA-methyltransferase n=1 Tax=Fibrobacter sp. TaxID=35828 RepID=UPI001B2924A8|nr:site-specific DNA-methyltransferase [Fibrobacter sp.]MBO7062252.1 site-specific DNA-methyltransferase [Fibrobacter sp.]